MSQSTIRCIFIYIWNINFFICLKLDYFVKLNYNIVILLIHNQINYFLLKIMCELIYTNAFEPKIYIFL